ncbi:pyridoxal-5-phosphate-dependent protein subunit beta [Carpediemonas membranifera]|uniref:Pyridoxal-5-phosphate-dependent protein subunit beta n=1 Tax=Carpediemonas membranifera TaxID=201153 RepID=A0A8J6B4I4_9EUKA|nr:pyridoxal-5-phosphate-dependent protein subunit beta [Carpediemonas membranifera]|eukprot:KAG9395538.1 pyridoxal-5-phosphate-dependent protein subunit beta [Carpediemonas membranifera]
MFLIDVHSTRSTTPFTLDDAVATYARLMDMRTEGCVEMTFAERKRVHNLKYFTFVEQQGKTVEELNAQWYDRNYWQRELGMADALNVRIAEFNKHILAGKTVAEFLKEHSH